MSVASIRVDAAALRRYTIAVFQALGLSKEDAAVGAEPLVWANLRGVDSHGVRWIPNFVRIRDAGHLNPTPNIRTLKETRAALFVEADNGLGTLVATRTMKRVIEKARDVGVGWALVRNSTTPLAVGYYTEMATKADMAGMAFYCHFPNMAPFGSKARGLHNAPVSFAVPRRDGRAVLLDMATSAVAYGKIDVARDKGESIPDGWALDGEGVPTTDPNDARILLPFGGPKGSGLSMLFECLTSVMAGDPLVASALKGEPRGPHREHGVLCAADISMFSDPDEYRENAERLMGRIKDLPKADGVDEIFTPGEPEERTREKRAANGVPVPESVMERLRAVADRFGVAPLNYAVGHGTIL